jgi:hypothetical protein
VVDLGKLAISQWLLGDFNSSSRVPLDVEVENRSDRTLGGAKRCDNEAGGERAIGVKQLAGEIFL